LQLLRSFGRGNLHAGDFHRSVRLSVYLESFRQFFRFQQRLRQLDSKVGARNLLVFFHHQNSFWVGFILSFSKLNLARTAAAYTSL